LPKSKRLDKNQAGDEIPKGHTVATKPHEGNSELTIKKIVVLEGEHDCL